MDSKPTAVKKNLHAGHRQRVRDKYISFGLESFNDVQMLELLLFYSYKRSDTNETAHMLYNEYSESIQSLFESSAAEISAKSKINSNAATLISSFLHISARYVKSKSGDRVFLRSFFDVGSFALNLFAGANEETSYLLCLDKNFALLQVVKLKEQSEISERAYLVSDIVENAIKFNASHAIIANNRLSDELKFNEENVKTAAAIQKALSAIEVLMLDHIIVSKGQFISFFRDRLGCAN